MTGSRQPASFHQSLADEPFLDQLGNLIAVLVHHDYVRIALEACIRQVDDIDAAARGFENRGIVDAALADLRPPGMVFGVVAVKHQDRRRLYGLHLVAVTAERRLDSNERLDLVGPRLCTSTTHGQILSTSSI